MNAVKHGRQFHFWIADREYEFLKRMADEQERSVASVLRRMIAEFRRSLEGKTNQLRVANKSPDELA